MTEPVLLPAVDNPHAAQRVAVPVGRTPEVPVSAQIVAPSLEDHSTLRFAELLAGEAGAFEPPPGFDAPGGLR
jgi:amidase